MISKLISSSVIVCFQAKLKQLPAQQIICKEIFECIISSFIIHFFHQ